METTAVILQLLLCANGASPDQFSPSDPDPIYPNIRFARNICADNSTPVRYEMKLMTSTDGVRRIVEISQDGEIRFQLLWDGRANAAPGFIADPIATQFWTYLRDAYTTVCAAQPK